MLTVDNSADGNCLFYAYSISLMYFLRAKNAPETTENIFNRLGLQDSDKIRLKTLLSKNANEAFTQDEIKTIIEPILGAATRKLGAERTRSEFLERPDSSPVFASANYGIEHAFKNALTRKGSPLASLIQNDFDIDDLTGAEIFSVRNMKQRSMRNFAFRESESVVSEFESKWPEKLAALSNKSPENQAFHKEQLLTAIIREKTTKFFCENRNTQLNRYVDHLNKNFQWGTEETLMALHRAITGEQITRNATTGQMEVSHETEILIQVSRNGVPVPVVGTPDIILNNSGNVHWTSKIPETIFDPKSKIEQQSGAVGQVDQQALAAFNAVATGQPKATEGFFAQMVNAIKTLWDGIKNIAQYIGQRIGVVSC